MDIRPEWVVKDQIPLPSLAKLSCNVGEPTDLQEFGAVEFYDKAYDKLSARMEKPLERTQVRAWSGGSVCGACIGAAGLLPRAGC